DRRKPQNPFCRIDGGRQRVAIQRLKRTPYALVDLRVADRDKWRQQQPVAACPDEGIGQGPHRTIIRKEDSTPRKAQRVPSELRDQPSGKRIGEGSVRRD